MTTPKSHVNLLLRSPFWAILPEHLPALITALTAISFVSSWEAAKPFTKGTEKNKIAVVPIQGTLTKDGPAWLGSNYDSIVDAAEKAAADPSVSRIVLAVDSPGGEVLGLPEAAAVLAHVATVKPLSAIVEGISASAAYWLTSQAQDITVTPSGEVGSVGVRMMHVDISGMLAKEGFSVTELYSGDYKTEWSPFHALTDDAKADMQTRLDAVHGQFIGAVAAGRGNRALANMSAGRFGEGRMFSATDALVNGMVDRVQPPREYYRAIVPVQEEPTAPARNFGLEKERIKIEKGRF